MDIANEEIGMRKWQSFIALKFNLYGKVCYPIRVRVAGFEHIKMRLADRLPYFSLVEKEMLANSNT